MTGPIPNTIDEFAVWAQSKCDDAQAIWDDYVKLSGNSDQYAYWYGFHEQGFPCMGFYVNEEAWHNYNSGDPTVSPSPMYLNLKGGYAQ